MENKKFYVLVGSISFTLVVLFGGLISWNILESKWRSETVKLSLEKGQNPLYVKCSMERQTTDECKIMMTIMAATKSDK